MQFLGQTRPAQGPTLFPYTTLFRSLRRVPRARADGRLGRPGREGAGPQCRRWLRRRPVRWEEHTSELQSRLHLVCRLLLERKNEGQVMARAERGQGSVVEGEWPAGC